MAFHPNTLKDNNICNLGDSNDNNHIDINLKTRPDGFYLNIYKIATSDIFKLKNINYAKKIMKLNMSIKTHNFENNKPKMKFFILLKTMAKIIILYESIKKNNSKAKMNLFAEI